MAALTVQNLARSGLEFTTVSAAAGGDTFANEGRTFLHIANASGADITVTFAAQVTSTTKPGFGTLTASNQAVTVTAGENRLIGFFEPAIFNNSSGAVAVSYSAVNSVTVAAIRCPMPAK
jgi:hypothetical protein